MGPELIYRGRHHPFAPPQPLKLDGPLQGWNYDHPAFEQIIAGEKQCRIIIEVGTLYGASAIHMAGICKRLGKQCKIICVDTWLGSPENWDGNVETELHLRKGYPRIYDIFHANVVRAGHQDMIIPCPMPSQEAANFLTRRGVQADLVYLDAGHTYEMVKADIEAYWPLLRPFGVMFGDDYDPYWAGVVKAVKEWAQKNSLQIGSSKALASTPNGKNENVKWALRKPPPKA